ncbi:fimbria/pilus outer membrane usher protein [Mesorhizobium sp. NPDC059024]
MPPPSRTSKTRTALAYSPVSPSRSTTTSPPPPVSKTARTERVALPISPNRNSLKTAASAGAEGKTPHRSAAVSYRSSIGRAEAAVEQFDKDIRATAQLEGAVAVAGGSVFATNRIDDAFAVVDVGAPDVEVQYQNRPVGKTGRRGKIIVPDLHSYEDNTVSINPGNLPVDADIPATKEIVVPADRSGVVVDFGVSDKPAAALVSFVDAGGAPLPVSSTGTLPGNPEPFVIGYDGEAYIRALKSDNSVTIDLGDGNSCQATFPYRANPGKQVVIRKVVCQ